jgi:hypothetical protein
MERGYGRGDQGGDAGGMRDGGRLLQMLGMPRVVRVALGIRRGVCNVHLGGDSAANGWGTRGGEESGTNDRATTAGGGVAGGAARRIGGGGSVVSSMCGPCCDEGGRLRRRGGEGDADDEPRRRRVLHMGEVLRVIARSAVCTGVELWGRY